MFSSGGIYIRVIQGRFIKYKIILKKLHVHNHNCLNNPL